MQPAAFSTIFKPIRIGKVDIKNRIVMAPMGAIGLASTAGGFTQRAIDYYVERAKGGTGLIITSVVKIENEMEKFLNPGVFDITFDPMHWFLNLWHRQPFQIIGGQA